MMWQIRFDLCMYVLVRESSRTLIFFTEVAFMKLFRFVSWSLLALGMTGCVSSDTLIKLNPDGSGTVIQKTLMNVEMLAQMNAMMQGIAKQTGAFESGKDSTVPELFSESQIRRMAAKMGEGVTFVSSRKIKAEQVEGFEATYAFKDITKLRISQKLGPPGPNEPGTAPDGSLPVNHHLSPRQGRLGEGAFLPATRIWRATCPCGNRADEETG
ncbi:MAG: hypothetical protein DMG05_16515 [Acidobacteria bacterium]|nr:MAG: hypothetical protein DMG05_16515 [Acidobacteriota bacterium]